MSIGQKGRSALLEGRRIELPEGRTVPNVSIGSFPEDTTSFPSKRRLLNSYELAAFLGVHPQTIYRLCRTGVIPHIRISGRCIRFDPRAIESWLRIKQSS
ncbi:MAG: helix-turn-helix domain-containing protein [Armatimonadota bacterium]|nr:helix-turn-helix domain-containing protein [Armatimonadota bacterium]